MVRLWFHLYEVDGLRWLCLSVCSALKEEPFKFVCLVVAILADDEIGFKVIRGNGTKSCAS